MKRFQILTALVIALAILLFGLLPISSPKESYRVILEWGGEGEAEGRLRHPMGIAWGDGFLYVADAENGTVEKFRADGSFVARWQGFKRPVAVATHGDFVYVADFLTDRISKLRSNGNLIIQWGRHGKGEGEFDAPSGIAADPRGDVYVSDFYNHRIQKFSPNGKFLGQWGRDGRRSGRLHYPTDVAVNDRGEVFVADAYNHRVQKFTGDGRYLAKWGGIGYGLSGKRPGWFRLAKAVAVDRDGHIYVADAFNHRVQKFTGRGELLAVWGSLGSGVNQVHYAAGVAVDPEGNLYVSDFFNNRVLKLVPM